MTDLLDLPALSAPAANTALYAVDPSGGGTDHQLSVAGLLGGLPVAPTVKPSALGTLLELDPADGNPVALPFRYTASSGNNPTSRDNIVHRWGINIDASGTGLQADATEPVVSFEIEEIFETGSLNLVESHWVAIDTDGSLRRPITWSFDRGDIAGSLGMALTSQSFSFNEADASNTQRVSFDFTNDKIFWLGGLQMDFDTNNVDALRQRNAANNADIGLIRVNANDQIEIGASGPHSGVYPRGNVLIGTGNHIRPENSGAGLEFGSDSDRVNGFTLWSSAQDVLRFRQGTGNWLIRAIEGSFQIRDDANGFVVPFQIDDDAPDNFMHLRDNGRIGINSSNPEIGLHLFGGEAGLGLQERGAPLGNPSDGHGFIYINSATGDLELKIQHDATIKTITLADFSAA